MASKPFKALKVPSSSSLSTPASSTESNGTSSAPDSTKAIVTKPEEISSPHELTAFVETLLGQLETKFDDMSSQILERMSQMSARVDSLETSIQDLINGDVSVPQSPAPGTPNIGRKGSAG